MLSLYCAHFSKALRSSIFTSFISGKFSRKLGGNDTLLSKVYSVFWFYWATDSGKKSAFRFMLHLELNTLNFLPSSSVFLSLAFCYIIGLPRVVAIYPLDELKKGRDVSGHRNPTARLVGVRVGPGPDGWPNTATEFFGSKNSYIEFPNRGKLDTRISITVLAWVLHLGQSGPIFNYNRGPRWGVHLWMTRPRQFFARFVKRDGRFTTPLVTHGGNVRFKAWNYLGATYDGNTGMATLWVNNRPVVRTNIGRLRLATNRPVRMGAKVGDRRYFRGRVSCVQVYSVALNRKQIIDASKRCFKSK